MTDEINYKNNPLHGLSLKNLLIELVDYYGFEILSAYLKINCFKTNPSIESSVKFLKKTDWAREKVEAFYMYQYKSLPRASHDQYELPPRDRIVPDGQEPGEPAELSLEDAERLHEKRRRKAAERGHGGRRHQSHRESKTHRSGSAGKNVWKKDAGDTTGSSADTGSSSKPVDPWANWKK